MSPRVLVAGLFHETHTFLSGETSLAQFEHREGDALLAAMGDGSPLAAVLEVAQEEDWQVLPCIDLRTTPSAIANDEVLEHFWRALNEGVRSAGGTLDGIYLVLHGAMVSPSHADVEGEILARLANLLAGRPIPICGVLDLHANYSARMALHADCLISYRENPHTDAHQAARDAALVLARLLREPRRLTTVWEQPPIVWPPTGTASASDPLRTLLAMARDIEARRAEIVAVNVFGGFAYADTPDTGVSFSAITAGDPATAQAELANLTRWAYEHRALGCAVDPPIEAIMPRLKEHAEGPVLLVEPSDNIGGGAPGDGTGVLRALVAHRVDRAVVVLNDPQGVAGLSSLPLGASATLPLGGRGSALDAGPFTLEVELVSRSNGQFDLEDRHSHLASMVGVHVDMGPSAVVRHAGVTILLTSRKTPPFDLGQLRSQGIVPEEQLVIGVKAAVAHRRAYDPIAKASYTVDTPGPCSSHLNSFAYRKLRRPIYPLDDV